MRGREREREGFKRVRGRETGERGGGERGREGFKRVRGRETGEKEGLKVIKDRKEEGRLESVQQILAIQENVFCVWI